ncbi:MAG: hypothetical protein Q4G44_03355 [Alcaligenaceae bacterium]|nr:hypothetical protein [Alcaligenaceae bacterium]
MRQGGADLFILSIVLYAVVDGDVMRAEIESIGAMEVRVFNEAK